jgi:outer membrane murein-binding lipoprotein Lpp
MENPKSTRPALVATLLVLILSGIFHATPALAQKEDEGASDTLSEITSAIAKLQEDVSATEEAVRSAGQSSVNAEEEINQAIAAARQVLESVGENGTLAQAINVAIENTRNEIKEVESEGLGDKEAQAVMAELKAEVEGELAMLVKSKRFLEAPDQKAVEDLINQLPFPGSDSSAPPAQPKPVAANPGGVAASGNAFNRKLTDLLIQPIPEKESYAENLEALRVRVEAIEAEVFKGVVAAAKSADPVGELSQARADLGEAVKLLQSNEGIEPARFAAKLRESIGAERKEIESKVLTAKKQKQKDGYLKFLSGLEASMEKQHLTRSWQTSG